MKLSKSRIFMLLSMLLMTGIIVLVMNEWWSFPTWVALLLVAINAYVFGTSHRNLQWQDAARTIHRQTTEMNLIINKQFGVIRMLTKMIPGGEKILRDMDAMFPEKFGEEHEHAEG